MARIKQEFYCTNSGGGCGGYFIANINNAINGIAEVVCPKCGHKHQRSIENGEIKEAKRFSSNPTQEICPTIATYQREPYTAEMKKRAGGSRERDSVLVEQQIVSDGKGTLLNGIGRWIERFGAR